MLKELKKRLATTLPFLQDKRLLIAVSGGIDSIVLADLMIKLDYDVTVAHCNFNLRGEESDGDEDFVRNFASEKGLELHVTRFDTKAFAADNKLSIQVAARELRYIWFDELLQENRLDYLLTAHHLDDSIETFLINLIRGTGIDGLTGIPQQNEAIVRPLLPFSRTQIEAYAESNKLHWREDSSNASDKYVRNKLRHTIVPELKALNPIFLESFYKTQQNIRQTASLANDAAIMIYQQVVSEHSGQKHISIEQLKRLPNYKAYLYQWLSPFGFSAWDDIYALMDSQSGKQIYSAGYRLLKDRLILILEPLKPADKEVYEIQEGVRLVKFPLELRLEVSEYLSPNSEKNAIIVNNNLIKFPLFVRKWQEGDYFYPTGMNGRKKKVSKYFKDEKMSLSDKENTWLLCNGNDIIWIIGRRADDRFTVKNASNNLLKIEVL